jgi:uncharacterized protein (DUF58 family)
MSAAIVQVTPGPVEARFERAARFRVAFGRRTFLLCACSLVFLGPAFVHPRVLWAMLAWNVVVLAAWLADVFVLPPPVAVEVKRAWSGPLMLLGSTDMLFTLTATTRVPLRVRLTVDLPDALAERPVESNLLVHKQAESSARISVVPRERGDAVLDRVFIRYQSPLGLAERWASASMAQTVRVFPGTGDRGEQSLNLLRTRRIEIVKRLSRRKGLGREFDSLREYREGDALRDVCWTATARRTRLIVKEYRIERSQPVWIVIDCGRLMRTRVGDRTKLDFAVVAALNLAETAMFGGDRVGLLAYGRKRPRMIGLGRGDEHLRNIMNQLALVKGEAGEADHTFAAATLLARQSRRSLVVWITDLPDTALTPEVIEGASVLLGRHLVVFAAIADKDLNGIASREAASPDEMFENAAAMDVLYRREKLIAALRGRGAHTLEVGTERLASAVVREYLSIKERELL